ncbi:MAG: LamB/YcsF family protein [Tepidimonas sp.]|nr:LamB/YcsF family protein [Tepidimonas sp.]
MTADHRTVDLNADLGESFGAWTMGDDEALLEVVDRANVACGFHAGDPLVMRRTVRRAVQRGVAIGAHPSFPDLQGFGRRRMELAPEELQAMLLYQIGALAGLCRAEGARLAHVKPHGALNNMACADEALARTVVQALQAYDPALPLLAPAHSALERAARALGQPVLLEVFADRAYQDDGQLVPRGQPGAVLHDPDKAVAHVMAMLQAGGIVTRSGRVLPTPIHSICVHGDSPQAVQTARRLRQVLAQRGWLAPGAGVPVA